MKSKRNIFAYLFIVLFICQSCKKENIKSQVASLTVVNAILDGTDANLGTNLTTINSNSYAQFGLKNGDQQLVVFPQDNPADIYYKGSISINQGDIYTLYLTGTKTAVEGIVLKDQISLRTDSTYGVRFINLLPGNNAVSVNLIGQNSGSEVNSLSYKKISEFKTYSAKNSINEMKRVFELRNGTTDVLLSSLTLSGATVPRFKNITIAIIGEITAPTLLRINNY